MLRRRGRGWAALPGGGGGGQPSVTAWPGDASVTIADGSNVFGTNLSGLSFESPSVLWAVNNGPGKLYRVMPSGTIAGIAPSRGGTPCGDHPQHGRGEYESFLGVQPDSSAATCGFA